MNRIHNNHTVQKVVFFGQQAFENLQANYAGGDSYICRFHGWTGWFVKVSGLSVVKEPVQEAFNAKTQKGCLGE